MDEWNGCDTVHNEAHRTMETVLVKCISIGYATSKVSLERIKNALKILLYRKYTYLKRKASPPAKTSTFVGRAWLSQKGVFGIRRKCRRKENQLADQNQESFYLTAKWKWLPNILKHRTSLETQTIFSFASQTMWHVLRTEQDDISLRLMLSFFFYRGILN